MANMKDSGVEWIGEIPEDWNVCRLAKTGDYINGNAFKPEDWADEGLPIIRIQDLSGSNDSPNYFKGQAHPKYLIHNGDVLVSWAATLAAYRWTRGDAWLNQHIFKVVPSKSMDTTYLYYLLAASMEHLDSGDKHGIMMQHLTLGMFNHCLVPLPSYAQQRAIGRALERDCSQIDATTNTLETQISTLERYRASVIHEGVTRGLDPTVPTKPSNVDWIGNIPQNWEIKKLKHLVFSFESGTSVRAASYPADSGEKGVLSLSSVFGGQYDPSANKRIDDDELTRASCPVKSGSLLVSRCNTSEWVGLPAFVEQGDPNLYLPDKLWQIDCGSPLFNKFVWYALHSKGSRDYCAVMSVGSSSSMQNIASFDLLNMYIPVPQGKEDLLAVVTFLDSKLPTIDAVIATKRKQLDVLKRRRQSLIYEYVTGKHRVGEEG